ncbi:DUF4342 domain-containing protein [Candidatus Roizmanbacteria bacterium]|nr:DUF4342 domain-containing protein [Candidatus Roizmanbacteria bacterium]
MPTKSKKTQPESTSETIRVTGERLMETVKKLLHEGNIRKIIIKNEKGETYIEIPMTVGVIGALVAPVLAAVGAIAALAANFQIVVEKKAE